MTATRKIVVAGVVITLLVMGALWWFRGADTPVLPVRGQAQPTPRVAAMATPEVAAESTPVPAAVKSATPPLLLASNAFTTLEDYWRRKAMMPQTPPPSTTPPAGRTPETELGRVAFMVRDFRAAFGSNPVGSNKEITRALMGDNARGTKFVDPATVAVNAKGELLDAWGRPYFFHAMSGKLMEIRSAGPDGKIFTDDDLVR